MCGIAGIFGGREDDLRVDILRRMRDSIRHRGPDDSGLEVLEEDRVGVAHVRLSILDLTPAGHQPMWNESRSVGIVFNGEIYNFREIRRELESLGKTFRSQCDTEVLVKGYEAWGRALIHRLNGMFAFAVWDKARKNLWITRDRLGVKPLYYWFNEARGLFIFASEIKAILQHPAVERSVDPEGLQGFLSLGYVPAPYTMFRGIRKLPAAHEMVLERGRAPRLERYWDVPALATRRASETEMRENVRHLFEESVRRRLISDVPLGAFLSGGVDSTLVVGMMSRLSKEPVRTFSAAFDVGPRSFKYNADADAAEHVAVCFGTRHTRLVIPMGSNLLGGIRRSIRFMDEPHGNPTVVTTLLLAEKVKREGISVVLSGDGSDEIFGGYSRYQADLRLSQLQKIPAWIRNLASRGAWARTRWRKLSDALEKASLDPLTPERLMTWWWAFRPGLQARILEGEFTGVGAAEKAMAEVLGRGLAKGKISHSDAMLYADLGLWIPEENNMRMDKTSMAVALETRAPFLDFPLVEYAMSLPFSRKAGLGEGKRLLKASFPDLLPEMVAGRSKWGWFSPVHYWIKDRLWETTVAEVSRLPETGVFKTGVRELVQNRDSADPMQLWMLLVFSQWHRIFIEEETGLEEADAAAKEIGRIHA